MINLKKFYYRIDKEGYQVLIPPDLLEEFEEESSEKFKAYRIKDIKHILLYIHPDDLK